MAYWPHDAAYLAEANRLLSLSAEDLARDEAWVVERDGKPAGFYRLTLHADLAEIEELFVEPEWIGHGIGRKLFEHAVASARRDGCTGLQWETDANAAGFYLAMADATSAPDLRGSPVVSRSPGCSRPLSGYRILTAVRVEQDAPMRETEDDGWEATRGSLELRQIEEPTSTRRGRGCLFWSLAVLGVLLIPFLVHTFVVQPFKVEEDSMEPLFGTGDWVLIDKVTPQISGYARGDIVLVKSESLGIYSGSIPAHLSRIIGQPGDTIEFDDGRVYVTQPGGDRREEGAAPPVDLFKQPDGTLVYPPWLTQHWVLSEGQYFALGDNRRELNPYFGWGPGATFEGRVWLR